MASFSRGPNISNHRSQFAIAVAAKRFIESSTRKCEQIYSINCCKNRTHTLYTKCATKSNAVTARKQHGMVSGTRDITGRTCTVVVPDTVGRAAISMFHIPQLYDWNM